MGAVGKRHGHRQPLPVPASRIPNIRRSRLSGGWWQPRVEVTLVKGRAFFAVIDGYYVDDDTAACPLIIGVFDGGYGAFCIDTAIW